MALDLSPLLNPESVTIIGVSKDPSRIGGRLLKYLTKHGYQGSLSLVNPKYSELNGMRCYSNISDIPNSIDCALIAVPGKHVLGVLNECADRNVKAAIIFSSGFAEMGESGKSAQNEIKALAETKKMRICGPNCIGIINFNNHIVLSFSQLLEIDTLIPGNIGFISQSGALGGSLVNRAQDSGIGLSYFISSGNEAVLEMSDYIKHLVGDESTEVITAVIEGFRDGPKFIEAAELALEHQKPLIVLKIGETEVGSKAAASHTGSMTGSNAVIDAVFNQHGVIRVNNYDDLFQTASLFSKRRKPKGNRVGILTSTGGGGIIMADYYTKSGLLVPTPSKKTKALASDEIAAFGKVSNPFDLTGQIFSDPEMFKRCMTLFVEEDHFDIIQVNVSMVAGQSGQYRAEMILESIEGSTKPIVTWWAAGSLSESGIHLLNGSDVALFRSPERCAAAVKALVKYHQFLQVRSEAAGHAPDKSHVIIPKERGARLLKSGKPCLSEHQSKALLKLYGIPVTREQVATSPREAVQIAEQIGFPVVLKVDSPDILHKTEANAIFLGVNSREDVLQLYDALLKNTEQYRPNAKINGILVQEMVQKGTEVMIGMSHDPQFGPTIAFGLGGIFVEVLKDIALKVTPLLESDAKQMVRQIKGYQILEGIRGKRPSDIGAIIDVLMRISKLAMDWKNIISEIDINPLVVFDDGQGVKALDALIVLKTNGMR
jgi:acetyltransferase